MDDVIVGFDGNAPHEISHTVTIATGGASAEDRETLTFDNLDINIGMEPHTVGDINVDGIDDFFASPDQHVFGSRDITDVRTSLSTRDFLILSSNFGRLAATKTDGDLDGKGGVDFADFLLLNESFGRHR